MFASKEGCVSTLPYKNHYTKLRTFTATNTDLFGRNSEAQDMNNYNVKHLSLFLLTMDAEQSKQQYQSLESFTIQV
jgi:hypothetical protein